MIPKPHRTSQAHPSFRTDDPSFAAQLDCRLTKDRNGEGYSLIRKRKR